MVELIILLSLATAAVVLFVRRKQPLWLAMPVAAIVFYFVVQVALVPMPFLDTIKFIFALQ